MAKSIAQSRGRLQLSKLDSQKELLADDIDLSQLALIHPRLAPMQISEAVIAGTINRTIEGASTVSITVNDRYGYIKRSGRLGHAVDIKLDGLWFRLVKVNKSGNDMTLTFESREVAILRTYNKFRASKWGQLTRSRFAQILVNEVKEFDIPFVCPELHRTPFDKKKSKENKVKDRDSGFGDWTNAQKRAQERGKPMTIKGELPTSEQLRNIEAVLDVGTGLVVRRKLLVCAMMTGIQESTCYNRPYGDGTSVGFFQQTAGNGWGTVQQRLNLEHSSNEFFTRAQTIDAADPKRAYGALCQSVQNSAYPNAYTQWRIEAERIVTAYGVAGGDTSDASDTAKANNMGEWAKQSLTDKFQFMRGRPKDKKNPADKEDSWTCLQRMADEVQWRCFEVSGAVYFISEPRLFKSAAMAHISQESDGVDWIDFDIDEGKDTSIVTITARIDRWDAPPGSIIHINDDSVVNGRWLVSDIERSIFSTLGTITCKKPRAKLPEPRKEDLTGLWDNKTQQDNQYEPPPGFEPRPPGSLPKGRALRHAVLNNPMITFTRASQRSDIQFGVVKPPVLRFMVSFTDAGFPIVVTALKSDHGANTNRGNPSAHGFGLAIDMGNYDEDHPSRTRNAMIWIGEHQLQLGFSQLIGPIDSLTKGGPYDADTLADHDDHIHVGWPLP